MNKSIFTFWIGLVALLLPLSALAAEKPLNTSFISGTTLHGYDPVSYFSGTPIEGDSKFAFEWGGGKWLFASQANLDKFKADPQAFAPQFGGYCAWAVSQGYTADVDPQAWDIVDGKLYLNYSKKVQAKWRADRDKLIVTGMQNWPRLIDTKK